MIFTIIGGALTLLTVYGAFTLSRKLFLSGVCFFSFLPIIGESMAYNTDKGAVHVIMVCLFLCQFVLALPNAIVYGPENAAATKLSSKIGLALLIINIGAAVFVLCLKSGVPAQFGYYHVVIAVAMAYLLIRRLTGAGAWLK